MLWPNKGLAAGVGAGAQEPRSEGVGVCAWVPGAAGDGAGGTRWSQGGQGSVPHGNSRCALKSLYLDHEQLEIRVSCPRLCP